MWQAIPQIVVFPCPLVVGGSDATEAFSLCPAGCAVQAAGLASDHLEREVLYCIEVNYSLVLCVNEECMISTFFFSEVQCSEVYCSMVV